MTRIKRFCQRDRKKYEEEELPCNRGVECELKKRCRYAISKVGTDRGWREVL